MHGVVIYEEDGVKVYVFSRPEFAVKEIEYDICLEQAYENIVETKMAKYSQKTSSTN